jgi:amino acid transporter
MVTVAAIIWAGFLIAGFGIFVLGMVFYMWGNDGE